jgi:hypothetical protein
MFAGRITDVSGPPATYIAQPPEPARFQLRRGVVFACLAVPWAVGLSWLAARAEAVAAPLVVFPLAVGLVLAGLLGLSLRACRLTHVRTAMGVALGAGLLAAAGQHLWAYRSAVVRAQRMQIEAEAEAARQIGRQGRGAVVGIGELLVEPPGSLWEFMQGEARVGRPLWRWRARGPWVWFWWAIDALLSAGAAAWGARWFARWPYCPRCESWYRTIRAGRLESDAVAELAAGLGQSVAGPPDSAHVQVISCVGGCGPVLLVVTGPAGRRVWRGWLSPAAAEQVMARLAGRC